MITLRIAVFSDTHGEVASMIKIIKKIKPDKTVHLGDTIRDAKEVVKSIKSLEVACVSGNNDFLLNAPKEINFEVDRIKIFACHGHVYNVKNGLSLILNAAKERKADVVLFGHTHKALNEYQNGVLLFNPGSLSNYGRKSYGVIDIADGKVKSDIFVL